MQDASNHPSPPLLITIFLGANDACLPPSSAHVPLPEFETHIRHYVDSILSDPATQGTRILLITPPPINIPAPRNEEEWEREIPTLKEALKRQEKEGRGYRTWCSKRNYARRIVELGEEYAGKSEVVGVLDFWTKMMEFGRREAEEVGWKQGVGDEKEVEVGCGLTGQPEFGEGMFLDGLHFGERGYEVLSKEVMQAIMEKWPELTRENLALVVE
jgi:isoamyl acetate esterase